MSKYRKKPIVVEAFQMTEERRDNFGQWPVWLYEAYGPHPGEGAVWTDPDDPDHRKLFVGTLEGPHRVDWDDWIIRGIEGELYPCKPSIFAKTYEPVEAGEEQQ